MPENSSRQPEDEENPRVFGSNAGDVRPAADEEDPRHGIHSSLKAFARYASARGELLGLEARQFSRLGFKAVVLIAVIALLLAQAYTILLVAFIALIAMATGWPWPWIAVGFAGLHLVISAILALVAKAALRGPFFTHTRKEWERDRQWFQPTQNDYE